MASLLSPNIPTQELAIIQLPRDSKKVSGSEEWLLRGVHWLGKVEATDGSSSFGFCWSKDNQEDALKVNSPITLNHPLEVQAFFTNTLLFPATTVQSALWNHIVTTTLDLRYLNERRERYNSQMCIFQQDFPFKLVAMVEGKKWELMKDRSYVHMYLGLSEFCHS